MKRPVYPLYMLLLFLIVTAVPASATADTNGTAQSVPDPGGLTPDELEDAGYDAIGARNWTGLLSIAGQGIAKDPENPVFHAMKGYALRKQGDYTVALAADTRSIELEPNPVRYANRGITFLAEGLYPDALIDSQASISLDPAYATAYALQAMAYLGMNETAAADGAISRAIGLEPGNAYNWHVQGMIAMKAGNCTRAIASLRRSVEIDPDYNPPWPGMSNATRDLRTAESMCMPADIQAAGRGTSPGQASPAAAFAILAAAGAVFLAGRRGR